MYEIELNLNDDLDMKLHKAIANSPEQLEDPEFQFEHKMPEGEGEAREPTTMTIVLSLATIAAITRLLERMIDSALRLKILGAMLKKYPKEEKKLFELAEELGTTGPELAQLKTKE